MFGTITSDWHIHSRNSYDCRQGPYPATMAETIAAAQAAGVTDLGITDHLNTAHNLPDIAAARSEFDALPPSPHVHFGVELSCMSAWELAEVATGRYEAPVCGVREGGPPNSEMALPIDEDLIARLGLEYVVAGVHWPLYIPYEREAIIRDYHRQNMFLVNHPLVDIIAHPWWWMGHWMDDDGVYRSDPWFDDFGRVPRSMHDEFAAAAREHHKVVEINPGVMLNRRYPEAFRRQYCEWLAGLQAAGVRLSFGSDHHAQKGQYVDAAADQAAGQPLGRSRAQAAAAMLEPVGIRERDLWRLPPRG